MIPRSILVPVGLVLVVGACGAGGAVATSAAPTAGHDTQAIVIRERVSIAAMSGAEIIATGDVLEGSTLGNEPFCRGGSIVDTHGSADPSLRLIVHTITCPDGTLSLAFAPDLAPGARDTGSWIVVGGSGAFDGLRGRGEMDVAYGPNPDSPADTTFTGTVSRSSPG